MFKFEAQADGADVNSHSTPRAGRLEPQRGTQEDHINGASTPTRFLERQRATERAAEPFFGAA